MERFSTKISRTKQVNGVTLEFFKKSQNTPIDFQFVASCRGDDGEQADIFSKAVTVKLTKIGGVRDGRTVVLDDAVGELSETCGHDTVDRRTVVGHVVQRVGPVGRRGEGRPARGVADQSAAPVTAVNFHSHAGGARMVAVRKETDPLGHDRVVQLLHHGQPRVRVTRQHLISVSN